MRLLTLTPDEIRECLPMPAAIETAKDAFSALSSGSASAPQRSCIDTGSGVTLVMGAGVAGHGLATKTVSVFDGNHTRGIPAVQGLVLVLDPETGTPDAILDGTFLTAWRTGAASGAATSLLARDDARVGLVIGSGPQARTQVLAIDAARELDTIFVYGRDPERANACVDDVRGHARANVRTADDLDAVLARADVLCTATNARAPLFDGDRLPAGIHVNAVGSFTPEMRELDATTIRRAKIFIDAVEAALEEAGELIAARDAGVTDTAAWTELGRVATGAPGRTDPQEITLFKSVGHAVQDVTAASRAVAEARARGLGRTIEI